MKVFVQAVKAAVVLAVVAAASFVQADDKVPGTGLSPVKIAVFTGNGARNVGAFRWNELVSSSKDVEACFLDGKAIREGGLDGVDVLVMPGGSATLEARDLGEDGRAKLKEFIKRGGGYVGTCAGCYLLMEPHRSGLKYLSVIPYRDGPSGGRTDISVKFNEKAEALGGIPPKVQSIRYAHGPVPVPTGHDIEDSNIEVAAVYNDNFATKSGRVKPFKGKPAAFAGTYGKGKIFVFTVHPESDPNDHEFISGAFKYVTNGREIKWTLPQRRPDRLSVGLVCTEALGPETAQVVSKIVKSGEFNIVPLNPLLVSEGGLDGLDAVVAPSYTSGTNNCSTLFSDNEALSRAFIERGGRVFAWGEIPARVSDKLKGVELVDDVEAAIAGLRGMSRPQAAGKTEPSGKDAAPLKVAVFVDKGARNVGAFRWIEIVSRCSRMSFVPVDGEAIRAGALSKVDVLVMPGGKSVHESKALGPDGREKVKKFIYGGGKYIGTCAGCCLLMESSKSHPDMLNIIPYKFGPGSGSTDLAVYFNKRCEALTGMKKGVRKIRYAEGPVLLPSIPVKDSEMEVVAVYSSDVNSQGGKPRMSMAGQTAAVAGTYGKGRVFVLAVHPESDVADHEVLRGAFKFLTGRNFRWNYPRRKRNQLSVGFMCDDSFGVETAKLVSKLVTEEEFEIIPLNKTYVADGALEHVDAVLAPAGAGSANPENGLYGDNLKNTKAFLSRGGAIFAWGIAAETAARNDSRIVCTENAEAALDGLRRFAATPAPAPEPFPAKAAHPIRVGVYEDEGGGNVPIATVLKLSPEYDVAILSASDYSKGCLDSLDMILQPGGGSTTQYKMLGEKGVEAIRRFVRNGGKYYGVCAGAFLATQLNEGGKPRMGLVPFKADVPGHYRGSAPVKIKLTEEGRKAFPDSDAERSVLYYGGPALLPGDPIEDSDVKILARYDGEIINTCQPLPVESMKGKGAIVGGRVGKGRVFLSCPHPEKHVYNFDMVLDGIKFLTGVRPTVVPRPRPRGALAVKYATDDKAAANFYMNEFIFDRRLDIRPGKDWCSLDNIDVLVFTESAKPDKASMLSSFIKRGGRVVLVADTPEKKKLAAKVKGAVVVDSYAKVIDAVLAE